MECLTVNMNGSQILYKRAHKIINAIFENMSGLPTLRVHKSVHSEKELKNIIAEIKP